MANIKLTNDNWETSGIYDIGQSKTQRVLNASFVSDISDLNGDVTALENEINAFVLVDSETTGTMEALCPRTNTSKIDLYKCISSQITDMPAASGVSWSSGKYLYVFVFGSSASNHVHYVIPSAASGVIGRVFVKLMQSGTESWKELMLGEIDVGQTLVSEDVPTGITGLFANKWGNVVTLYTKNTTLYLPTITSRGWVTLGTLPESLYPKTSPDANSYVKSFILTNASVTVASIRISSSTGVVEVYGDTSYSAEALNIFFTYLTA